MVDVSNLWPFEIAWGPSQHPAYGASLMDTVAWFENGVLDEHHPSVCPVLGIFARIVNMSLTPDARQHLRKYIPLLARTADAESATMRFQHLVKLITRLEHPVLSRIPFVGAKLVARQMADMMADLHYAECRSLVCLFHLTDARLLREFDRLIAIGKPSRPWTEQRSKRAVRRFAAAIASRINPDLEDFALVQ